MERWTTIRALHAKGMPKTDIARRLRVNYKTVRTYADAPACPHIQPRLPRSRRVTPYEPYLRARWVEGCRNGKQLYREIKAHGFRGSRVLVAMVVAQWRRDEGLSMPWLPTLARQQPLTPCAAAQIILRRPHERRDAEQHALVQVRTVHAELDHLVALSERYAAMIRHRQADRFTAWITDAQAGEVQEIRQFARNLRNDEAAIRAALIYEHSNGQVEGQVHRLKLIKRAMYGRAKFDLLRQRVLYAT